MEAIRQAVIESRVSAVSAGSMHDADQQDDAQSTETDHRDADYSGELWARTWRRLLPFGACLLTRSRPAGIIARRKRAVL